MKTKEDYYKDYLKALVGGKIVEVIVDASNEEYLSNPYLGFIVKKGKKTFQFVALRDPEGNGAGHMEITEITLKLPILATRMRGMKTNEK